MRRRSQRLQAMRAGRAGEAVRPDLAQASSTEPTATAQDTASGGRTAGRGSKHAPVSTPAPSADRPRRTKRAKVNREVARQAPRPTRTDASQTASAAATASPTTRSRARRSSGLRPSSARCRATAHRQQPKASASLSSPPASSSSSSLAPSKPAAATPFDWCSFPPALMRLFRPMRNQDGSSAVGGGGGGDDEVDEVDAGAYGSQEEEEGQTFDEYLHDAKQVMKVYRPTKTRRTIYIQPVGDFGDQPLDFECLHRLCSAFYHGLNVEIRSTWPIVREDTFQAQEQEQERQERQLQLQQEQERRQQQQQQEQERQQLMQQQQQAERQEQEEQQQQVTMLLQDAQQGSEHNKQRRRRRQRKGAAGKIQQLDGGDIDSGSNSGSSSSSGSGIDGTSAGGHRGPGSEEQSGGAGRPAYAIKTPHGLFDLVSRTRVDSATGQETTQFCLNEFVDAVLYRRPRDAWCVMAITLHDLFETEDDEFCMGRAWGGSRAGVVGFRRYKADMLPPTVHEAGLDPQQLLTARSVKTLIHEIGHCFLFDHCTAFECLMNATYSLQEDIRIPLTMCPVDLRKLHHSLREEDPRPRFHALLAVYTRYHRLFAREHRHILMCIQALDQK